MKIEEASEIIFPVLLAVVDEAEPENKEYAEAREWAKATLNLIDKLYPEDVFDGSSGDKGALAILTIRKFLKGGIKK